MKRRGGVIGALAIVVACTDDGGPRVGSGPADAGGPIDGGDGPDGTLPGAPLVDGARPNDAGPTPAPFGLDVRPTNARCRFPDRPAGLTTVKFERVYAGLALGTPIVLAQRPGDGSRWYVAQRDGQLEWFPAANPAGRTVAADLGTLAQPVGGCSDKRCVTTYSEGGFLGLAFHPRFAENGRAFVSFTPPQLSAPNSTMRSVIAELTSTDGGDTFTGYRTILAFDNLEGNHKGGGLVFGLDGYLYATFGDGGSLNDAFAKGQTKDGFFAKVLRLDVDGPKLPGREYGVPPDNPFRDGGGDPAVFAWGFRNPFRISVDRGSGDLWVGDVGQETYEEIDKVELGGNYGWSCREGAHPFHVHPVFCPDLVAGFREPVVEYTHGSPPTGRAVIGGVVYRGKSLPGFVGKYVFGDHITHELWSLAFDAEGAPVVTTLNDAGPSDDWVSFTEDVDGEVYAVSLSGAIYKLVESGPPPPPSPIPTRLALTGCVDPENPKRLADGVVPYTVNAAAWNDGAEASRGFAIPDGATIAIASPDPVVGGRLVLPTGSVALQTLSRGGKAIETRVLARDADGSWAGYSYEWNDAGTDATLLDGSKSKPTGDGTSWYFPSRSECARCHGSGTGGNLGLEVAQLNRDGIYPSTNRIANQLATLDHVGLLTAALGGAPTTFPALPDPRAPGPIDARARAYLHVNCSGCHRPSGTAGTMDLRFSTPLAGIGACNVDPSRGTLGIANAKLIAPGEPARSLLAYRPRQPGANRMPPLATRVVDTDGAATIASWVGALTACP